MTELVRREPVSQQLATLAPEQLKYIANTDFIPKGMRGNLPAILACVATGRALGLSDMVALRSIHVIDGRATMSAELMVNLVRRGGHSISGSTGIKGAKVTGRRGDTGDEMTYEFGPEDAARAGLQSKANYQKHPASMYWARAVSQLCRMLFADCLGGVSLTPDEAELTPEERIEQTLAPNYGADNDGPVDALEQVAEEISEDGVNDAAAAVSEVGAPAAEPPEQTSFADRIPPSVRRKASLLLPPVWWFDPATLEHRANTFMAFLRARYGVL